MAIVKIKSKKYGQTYQADIRYKDVFGVSKRHIKSGFRELQEAKDYQRDFLEQKEAEILSIKEHKITFNQVYLEYIEVEGVNKYANATKIYYNTTFENYIKGKIGQEKISAIKYLDLQKFFNDAANNHNKATLKNMKKIFSITFQYALRTGYVSENPVILLQLPKESKEKVQVKTISDEDLNKIINSIQVVKATNPYSKDKNPQFTFMSYAMALIIGRYTGLRIGEALALHKSDFDFKNKTLNVHRKIEYIGLDAKNIYATENMKTKNSKAKIAINDTLIQYLKPWFKVNPFEIVVCDSNGKYIYPATLQKRIRDVSQSLEIDFHYHMLRHTYATELMMNGVNPVVVKELLRHSEVNTTCSIYTHPQDNEQREALDNLYMEMK